MTPQKKDFPPRVWLLILLPFFVLLVINFIGLVAGAQKGMHHWRDELNPCDLNNKWAYITPTYKSSCLFFKWMGE